MLKEINKELPKAYNPADYEELIYSRWEKSGFFNTDNLKGEPYSIMMPPPNVTGVLHLGHALENSLMDIMARYQRMRGKKVLLLPGTDHAAVATQAKVEKILIGQGLKNPRQTLGREKLLEKIREYAEASKATILQQIKKMGTSCDWSRLAYTFDQARSRAVNEIFVKMYNDGLIYRDKRIINWDAKLQTTISDDEIVWQEEKAPFYYLRYGPFVIATARPETKFGDKYVVMHPDDKRYKKYKHGDKFDCEWINGKVAATVIKDKIIDPKFGSGVMTITPWHDMVDFEIAQQHGLSGEQIIDFQGKLLPIAGEFAGLDILTARPKIVAKLKGKGLVVKVEENYLHRVAKGDRSGGPVEPQIKEQWFVAVNKKIPGRDKSLKDLMREAVTSGHNGDPEQKVKITPERFENVYKKWIDNLHDWCISRQIWWGHRVPVYYRRQGISNFQFPISNEIPNSKTQTKKQKLNEEIYVGVEPPQGKGWVQDEDTLDTWFSSGLWTFSALGWPRQGSMDIITSRHCTTDIHNARDRFIGQEKETDFGLNEEGKKQAEKLAMDLKSEKIDIIFTSPLKRVKETALIVNKYHDVPIIEDKRLLEYRFGFMNGKTRKELLKEYPDLPEWKGWDIDYQYKDEERPAEVMARVQSFLQDLKNNYSDKRVYVVTSAGPLDFFDLLTNKKDFADIKDLIHKKGGIERYKLRFDEDLKTFHPTSWMQMGYEILFFWMARMILMSTYALDQIPFKDVYIHGMLRNELGKKFSKSLGDNIDPLEIIKKYGTDALRLSLISGIAPGNDSKFYEEKVEGARNLVNKLWNVARYIAGKSKVKSQKSKAQFKIQNLIPADKWILGKLDNLIREVTEDLDGYDFSLAGEKLRVFTWDDLADWYLEVSKFEKNKEKDQILYYVLENLLKLWHPFLPFVTEVIWQEMGNKNLLMAEKWPDITPRPPFTRGAENAGGSENFEVIKEIITAIRNARAENKIEPTRKFKAVIYAGAKKKLIESQANLIKNLRTGISELEILKHKSPLTPFIKGGAKGVGAIYAAAGGIEIYLFAAMDKEKEKIRLEKEIANLEKVVKVSEGKLANKEFAAKAPTAVVTKEKDKLKDWRTELKKLREQLKNL